jgi:hypothetical protein
VLVMLGGWLITVLYGAAQHFGLDPFIWRGAFGLPVFSTFGNPNLFGASLLLGLPLALAAIMDEDLPLWGRGAAAAGALLGACALVWTRTYFETVVFIIEIAVVVFLSHKVLRGERRNLAIGAAVLCLAVFIAVLAIDRRAYPDNSGRTKKEFVAETWKGTLKLIATRPLLGSGPGSFFLHYPAFRRPGVILNERRHNTETDHPQNELLEQWVEGGLIGLALWLWLFGAVLYKGWKLLENSGAGEGGELYPAGIYAGVVCGFLLSLVSIFTRFPAPGCMLMLMSGFICVVHRSEPGGTETVIAVPLPAGRWRYLLLAPVVLSAGWLSAGVLRVLGSDIKHNMAIFYKKAGDWENALKTYDSEVWGSPMYVMAQYFKGNVLNDRNGPGDAERAAAQYRFVRSLAPDYVQVHYHEAVSLTRLGREAEAIEHLERQVRLDPVWDAPWDMLAELYRKTGEPAKAAAAAKKALEARELWEQAGGPERRWF